MYEYDIGADWPRELRNLTYLILSAVSQNPKMAVTSRLFRSERTDDGKFLETEQSLLQAIQNLHHSATTELILTISKRISGRNCLLML